MYNTLILDHNDPNSGFLASRDPRGKILIMILLLGFILSLEIQNLAQILVTFVILILLMLMSGKSLLYFPGMIIKLLPMFILISFILPFRSFAEAEQPLWQLLGIPIYSTGLTQFLEINIKFVFFLSTTLIFLAATSIQEFMKSLEAFRLPVWLSAILYYMIYFIFLLKEELFRQYLAYKSRYIQLPFLKRLRIISRMTAVYFIRVIERNERVSLAMISRGFSGKVYNHKSLSWTLDDSVMLSVTVCIIILLKVFV